MINFLKEATTLFNLFLVMVSVAFALRFLKKRRGAAILFGLSCILFISFSTNYLPFYLASKLESKYVALKASSVLLNNEDSVFIVVLASGYSIDPRLPAINQLDVNTLARLAEGVRIKNIHRKSILVCSGYSSLGLETQASIAKKAAIELGIREQEIITLDGAGSTIEEASEFKKKHNGNSPVILVTDAIHMARAVNFFTDRGVANIIPAPTNFRTKKKLRQNVGFLPSLSNIGLAELVFHEYLGELKYRLDI